MEENSIDEPFLPSIATNQTQRLFDKPFLNIIFVGTAFMLVFSVFNTYANMSQVVIDSIQKEVPSFHGSGYVSLAVIYTVFALANWVSPSVLSVLGPKWTMILGAITYVLFMGSFLWPQTWLLYGMSVLIGFGAAFMWTGQGNYLTLLSNERTMARNAGVFWSILQLSFLFGNLIVFFQFQDQKIIGHDTRFIVYSLLTAVGGVGVLILCFISKPPSYEISHSEDMERENDDPIQALKRSFALCRTKNMLLLSATFLYTGISFSFYSGVYSSALSFTLRFQDSKRLVGISGMFIGCGEILGGLTFGIFGKKMIKWGRDPIVLLGFVIHTICFFLIFLNLPLSSPLGNTNDPSYLPYGKPSEILAMVCSFLLGFGDAYFNTQIFSILGVLYSGMSGPAFALFYFVQSLAAATCFFYSSILDLRFHFVILILFGVIGTKSFCIVEWNNFKKNRINDLEN